MRRHLKKQSSVEQNEKSFADRDWKQSESKHPEGLMDSRSGLRSRHSRRKNAAHSLAGAVELDQAVISRPSDILTIEELQAFAADVADMVDESRLNLLADRMLLDIARLDDSSRQLSEDVRMHANRQSAQV